jgi:hypothetical protein
MRSPLTLGIVFVGLAAFCFFASPGTKISPVGMGLAGLLAVAGVLVMTRLRAGFYVGLVAGAAVAIAGILTWTGVGGGRLSLPVDPRIEVVLGLYMCFRMALAEKFMGPQPKRARPLSDEGVE